MLQRYLLPLLYYQPVLRLELFGPFHAEIRVARRGGVIWDAPPGLDERRAPRSLFRPHVENAVAAEKGVVEFQRGQLRHLLRGRSIAAEIGRHAVAERQDVANAFARVVVWIVPRLDGPHRDVAEVEAPVFASGERLGVRNDTAAAGPFPDQLDLVVVGVPVGDEDQIRRQFVALARVWVDVDDLAFARDDPDTCVPLIQKPRQRFRLSSRRPRGAQAERGAEHKYLDG